ncbi:MAG: 1-(5-phosphoribosyl)-5-[(5-phosphoribosylamino)methylideneamino]imidazole-4-carboxamide isomerase [Candidatus Omnitrophota bacterium]
MIIIPAIDIKDGNVVRLSQGRFDQVTEYAKDPIRVAKDWEKRGAERIHVVDLDGAQSGRIKNLAIIKDIAQAVSIPIEMGGGIRNKKDIDSLISSGIAYVILGTKIIDDKNFLKSIIDEFKEKILVSLDCSGGKIATQGWTSVSALSAVEFAKELEQLGLHSLVYTDIARDGTLAGPNFAGVSQMIAAVNIPVIASGGVAQVSDIQRLLEIKPRAPFAAIIGKALYENKIVFEEALKLCREK